MFEKQNVRETECSNEKKSPRMFYKNLKCSELAIIDELIELNLIIINWTSEYNKNTGTCRNVQGKLINFCQNR